jgi:hypothetical protein
LKNILVIDLLSEPGHVNTNIRIIDILQKSYNITYITDEEYSKKFDSLNVKKFNVSIKIILTPLGFRFNQIISLQRVKRNINKEKFQIVIFLGYETISMSFFLLTIKKSIRKKLFILNHNNIDELLKSKVKKWVFNNIMAKINHLAYEPYIKKYLEEEYGKKAYLLSHPIPITKKNIGKKVFQIFCPSSGGKAYNSEIVKFAKKNTNINFIIKGDTESEGPNYVIKKHFDQYFEILKESAFVLIPVQYKYRVSGVIYESLANNCTIIMLDSLYAKEMKFRLPEEVYIIKKIKELNSLIGNLEIEKNKISYAHTTNSDSVILKNFLKLSRNL